MHFSPNFRALLKVVEITGVQQKLVQMINTLMNGHFVVQIVPYHK